MGFHGTRRRQQQEEETLQLVVCRAPNRILVVQLGVNAANAAKVFNAHAAPFGAL